MVTFNISQFPLSDSANGVNNQYTTHTHTTKLHFLQALKWLERC